MITRIVVGAALIAFAAGAFWLDWHLERAGWPELAIGPGGRPVVIRGLPLAVLTLVVMAAAYRELAALSAAAGVTILGFTGMLCTVIVATLPFWQQGVGAPQVGPYFTLSVLGGVMMALFAAQIVRYRIQEAIRRLGGTMLAVGYLGICGAVLLGIRVHFGVKALALFLVAVKVTDIGAYFTGTAIGRHKLIPSLSPRKSWEGLLGGMVAAGIATAAFAAVVNPVYTSADDANMNWAAAGLFGVAIGLFGQGGDLCESALKRDARAKDAGRALPAFGGVLDVLDSPLLAAPAGFAMLWLLL